MTQAGRVLLFAAEDALHIVRRRLEGISAAAGVALADLDIQVITASTVRLDLEADRRNLAETVARLQPRLLILDPFVRLHRIDENASGEVAPLLAYLRELQRRHGVAVLVVHHAKKGGGGIRAGQALRGSSEFHAWGDSNVSGPAAPPGHGLKPAFSRRPRASASSMRDAGHRLTSFVSTSVSQASGSTAFSSHVSSSDAIIAQFVAP